MENRDQWGTHSVSIDTPFVRFVRALRAIFAKKKRTGPKSKRWPLYISEIDERCPAGNAFPVELSEFREFARGTVRLSTRLIAIKIAIGTRASTDRIRKFAGTLPTVAA